MYKVNYLDKEGKGFSDTEPWVLDEYDDINEAKEDADRLITEGYKNVEVVNSDDELMINSKLSYKDLAEALKYAHRFAKRNDMYDVDYVQDIIDKVEWFGKSNTIHIKEIF